MNLGQLWNECGRLLGDPNNDRWNQTVLTTRINQSQIEIQAYTNAVKTSESLTPVASTRTITLNSDTMDIVRATKTQTDGSIKPLTGMAIEVLDYLYPDWQQWKDGEPLYWFYDATNQQMNLVPKPDSNNAITNGITVWESQKPADLVNSTDIPFDGNNQMIPFHFAIVHWVVALCFQDDGTDQALTKSRFHKSGSMLRPGEYEKEVSRILAEFDTPEVIPSQIQFKPAGGRVGTFYYPSKANPLIW